MIPAFAIVLALVTGVVLGRPISSTVCACTPPPGGLPRYTVADRTHAADVVLEGSVIALTGDYFIHTATVDVHRYFKHRGPATVTIWPLGASSLCLSPMDAGQRWVFYATGDPNTGLRAHYLSQFDAVDPADPQTISEVIAAAGQDPATPYGFWLYLPGILQ